MEFAVNDWVLFGIIGWAVAATVIAIVAIVLFFQCIERAERWHDAWETEHFGRQQPQQRPSPPAMRDVKL